MLKIKDLKTLRKLKSNNKLNELALIEETHTLYKWNGADWEVQGHTGIDVSLFELNQGAMTSLPEYTDEQISAAKSLIDEYCCNNQGTFYMLLSNEQKYYTLFNITGNYDYPVVENEVVDCLRAVGTIKDVSLNEQNVIECWVTIGDTSYVYYFFNYDKGVILCA